MLGDQRQWMPDCAQLAGEGAELFRRYQRLETEHSPRRRHRAWRDEWPRPCLDGPHPSATRRRKSRWRRAVTAAMSLATILVDGDDSVSLADDRISSLILIFDLHAGQSRPLNSRTASIHGRGAVSVSASTMTGIVTALAMTAASSPCPPAKSVRYRAGPLAAEMAAPDT